MPGTGGWTSYLDAKDVLTQHGDLDLRGVDERTLHEVAKALADQIDQSVAEHIMNPPAAKTDVPCPSCSARAGYRYGLNAQQYICRNCAHWIPSETMNALRAAEDQKTKVEAALKRERAEVLAQIEAMQRQQRANVAAEALRQKYGSKAIERLREVGLTDAVIQQIFSGAPASREEVPAAPTLGRRKIKL